MINVFMGGTCEGYNWRKDLEEHFKGNDKIRLFNPVVDDWNEEAKANEIRERENCDFCLYTITPHIRGVYSIAEVIDDSNKRPNKTLFCYIQPDGSVFDEKMYHSLQAVGDMVERNGGNVFTDISILIEYFENMIELSKIKNLIDGKDSKWKFDFK